MTFNPKGSPAQIAWSVFGGLDTELAPPTQPEGLSPDCQDVQFVPGSVATRPGLARVLAAGAFGASSVNYNKTFTQPTLKPVNLYLTGSGEFAAQDPATSNAPTQVFDTVAGAYATSITAFGREYIAISDGQVALDIPRQYDPSLVGNSQWRRLTQDGPAAANGQLTAADAASSNITISSGNPDGITPNGVLGGVTITAATNVSQVVTITTSQAHKFNVNDIVIVYGVTPAQYNGSYTITSIPTSTSFTYNVNASFGNGTSFGVAVATKATVKTTTAHNLIAGETIVISGDSNNSYNNSQTPGIGLLPGSKCKFYAYNGNSKGAFSYFNGGLPGSTGSFTFGANHSIMLNPSLKDGTVILPGAPGDTEDVFPMNIYGVNASGSWDGTNQSIGGQAVPAFNMTLTFNLSIPQAGSYFFRFGHDDGAFMAIGGGTTLVTGTLRDGFNHTTTAEQGLAFTGAGSTFPLVGSNGSPNFYNTSYFLETFSVSFPTAGIYPGEIDYQNWESAGFLTLQYSTDGVTWKTILPGVAAFATPPTWTVLNVIDSKTFTFNSVYAGAIGEGGTIQGGGLTAPGIHQLCVSFQTDTGYLTKPSPIATWTAAGNKRVTVSGLPIGPPNVVARIVHFTGAGGGNFFYLPVASFDPTTGTTVATSTVVNDNTSTTATFDFSDNTLFNGIGVDITGNNLFNMTTLGPCAGVFAYSNRLIVWGDTNKLNNLLNMGFEGGTATVGGTTPLGWSTDSVSFPGGALVAAGDFYNAWQITGNGLNVARGLIYQPAYQDSFHIPILTANTQYTFQAWVYASAPNMAGQLTADLFSATGGVLATASIAANTMGVGSANGAFLSANFSALTPATIPTDTVLRIYAQNLGNNQSVTVDEMMIVYTENPVIQGQARVSYGINPEAFDGVTGIYAVEYSEPLRSMKIIRDNLYTLTSGHLLRTNDNGLGEPITWTNYTVSDIVGGMSVRAFDVGEGWGMFAAESGLYAFSGGHPEKVSQEIQTLWTAIDPNLRKHVWVTNDPINRRIYIGVPLTAYSPTGATYTPASCNKLLVLDYRNLNTAEAIQGQGPVRLGFSGKLIATDFARKWTVWNIPANHGSIMSLGGDQEPQIVFGGGNGLGLSIGFGNSYSLSDANVVDDDYGAIGSLNGEGVTRADGTWRPTAAYYVTYFAPSHEQEQIYQTGSARKLFPYLSGYVSGIGYLHVVPLIDRLGKATVRPPKGRLLSADPSFDLEWPLNIQANRMALLIYALPTG